MNKLYQTVVESSIYCFEFSLYFSSLTSGNIDIFSTFLLCLTFLRRRPNDPGNSKSLYISVTNPRLSELCRLGTFFFGMWCSFVLVMC